MIDLNISIKINVRMNVDMDDFAGDEDLINFVEIEIKKNFQSFIFDDDEIKEISVDVEIEGE